LLEPKDTSSRLFGWTEEEDAKQARAMEVGYRKIDYK
jgi:hypothetical protein